MASEGAEDSLQVLFSKAFLIELERGDIETARVFARAFLLRQRPAEASGQLKLLAAA